MKVIAELTGGFGNQFLQCFIICFVEVEIQ